MVVHCAFCLLYGHHADPYSNSGLVHPLMDLCYWACPWQSDCCPHGIHLCHLCLPSLHRHLERADVCCCRLSEAHAILSPRLLSLLDGCFINMILSFLPFSPLFILRLTNTGTATWLQEHTQLARSSTAPWLANAGTVPKVSSSTKRLVTT